MKFDVAITFYTPGCALFFPILKAKCCFWPTFKEARTEWPTPCGCLWFLLFFVMGSLLFYTGCRNQRQSLRESEKFAKERGPETESMISKGSSLGI